MKENSLISTPILDFVQQYAEENTVRLHMPGHKGKPFLGFEAWDITEIGGADSLYEAEGIIAESEANATSLFDSKRTLYSTEGSSQCIRAMLYLALLQKKQGMRPVVVAARNVHKAFIYAATLLDFDVIWLWPEQKEESICSCHISKEQVEKVLEEHEAVLAVYLTSPDYLGGQQDIRAIAEVCHNHGVLLTVDNAHGAYLKFLEPSQHPLDLGADLCCDSAHKTLPVLTGGAYLHIGKNAPDIFTEQAKYALNLFGSTSPSYLTLSSLDMCNQYLAGEYVEKLKEMNVIRNQYANELIAAGWQIVKSDPLKITIAIPNDTSSSDLAQKLREKGIECEYVDQNYIVFMLTPENTKQDLERLLLVLGKNEDEYKEKEYVSISHTKQMMSIREAMLSLPETVSIEESTNRICRVPTVSCPPAIPIAVPGELITQELITMFQYYGITSLDVVKE